MRTVRILTALTALLTAALLGSSAAQASQTASRTAPSTAGRPTIGFGANGVTGQSVRAASAAREVWYGYWYPSPVCNGDVCSITSIDDLPHFWISGQNFKQGSVYVGIFNRDGTPIISTTVTARVWAGFVNYSWGWKANRIDCAAIGAPIHDNAFIQAKDLTNNLWSNRIFVTTDCAVL